MTDDESPPSGEEDPSLDEIRQAVDRLADGDEDWIDLHWYVVDALHDRFLENDEYADLQEAIIRGWDVLAAERHSSAEHLADLALMIFSTPDEHFTDADLETYIELLQEALAIVGEDPDQAKLRSHCQTNLAVGLLHRPNASAADRTRAVALWEAALGTETLDDDDRGNILGNLAEALSVPDATRDDRDKAVHYGRLATEHLPSDPELAAHAWFGLANALEVEHDHGDGDGVLDEAIRAVRNGLEALGEEHPDYPGFTTNLVSLLRQRSRETRDQSLLDEGIRLIRQVALPRTTSPGHPDRGRVLLTAAAILSEVGYWQGEDSLVIEAIDMQRSAITFDDASSESRGLGLVNLSATLRDAADRLKRPDLLDEAVQAGHDALEVFEQPGARRAAALTATSNVMRDVFLVTGSHTILRSAIDYAEQALTQTDLDHREYPARETNLAVLLSDDFTATARLPDLDRAIDLYRSALTAPESVEHRIAERRNDLALALRDRFRTTLNIRDLDEALELGQRVVDDTEPEEFAWAGYANNYANALAEKFETTGEITDLEAAIDLFAAALSSAAGRAAEESGYATNLGLAYAARAHSTDTTEDLATALTQLHVAVTVLPPTHPERANRTSNLADVYRQRSVIAERNGRRAAAWDDGVDAVRHARDAVSLAQEDQASLLPALANLARALRWLRRLDTNAVPDRDILEIQRRAAHLTQISPAEQFTQKVLWAEDAERVGDFEDAMDAYRQAGALNSEVAWIGLTVAERQTMLDDMADALTRAVSFAIARGRPWDALSWADQVRSVLWRQSLHLRSAAAQQLSVGGEPLAALMSLRDQTADDGGQRHREERRRAAHSAEPALRLGARVPEHYESLDIQGTLVLLVPGENGSTALLVGNNRGQRTVSLSGATSAALERRAGALRTAFAGIGDGTSPATHSEMRRMRHTLFDCLEWLWDKVVEPVLADIPTETATTTRIWFSPLGDFALLPLHAAGRYPRNAAQFARRGTTRWHSVADHAICAYLPTILEPEPPGITDAVSAAPRMLYVSTDAATGTLDYAAAEHQAVRKALRSIETTELIAADATVDAARSAIPNHRYLHVTAHGHLETEESLHSGFRLSDGTFTVTDLAESIVHHGELAVFLTCDSASGDVHLPNEALHLAGAARQAGFPAVIATTMPVRDSSAVPVVTAIYQAVEAAPQGIGAGVADALHRVTTSLRLNPETGTDPLTWVPYAYFGWGLPAVRDSAGDS